MYEVGANINLLHMIPEVKAHTQGCLAGASYDLHFILLVTVTSQIKNSHIIPFSLDPFLSDSILC